MLRLSFLVAVLALVAGCDGPGPQAGGSAARPETAGASLRADVKGASFDYSKNKAYLDLALTSPAPYPEKVWVWAYFVNPSVNSTGSWSAESVEVVRPFAKGSPAQVRVESFCHWCDNPDLPKSGYFARVRVSASSAEDAKVPSASRKYTTDGAVPVR